MAAIARVVVISALFYLVRFTLAHQHQTQSKYSDSDSASSLQEDNVSGYEESNEKVLIRSGVPLRGRTIHQTAWSEEEKVSVPDEKETLQQPDDQNAKEEVYTSWGLTDAINYILSFIYGTEIDDKAIISNKLAENSIENVNIPKKNLDEIRNHQTSIKIKDPKEKLGNIPMFNKDSVLQTTTTKYPIASLGNQDIEGFRNEISSLSDEYAYEPDSENSESSNEITDPDYEEVSYKHEDYDIINKDKVNQMHSSGSLINDAKDDSTRSIMVKTLTEIREKEPEFVSVAKSQESEPDCDKNTDEKSHEDDIHPARNTKTSFDQRNMMPFNGFDKNVLQSTNRHPEKQSKNKTMKGFIGTENFSQRTNPPAESVSIEDIFTEKSMKEDIMQNNVNYDKNEGGNVYASTERTTVEDIMIEIPPTTSYLQIKRQSQKKELSSKSNFSTQTEKPSVLINKNKQGKKHEVNRLFATTENFKELQHEKVFTNPNYVTEKTVKFTDRAQTNKPSQFPRIKPLKYQEQEHLKPKQKYLGDVYFDLEPDDVRSYNYLLDSYEFIRVGNNNNKVDKKHDDSIYVIIQDKERSSAKESPSDLSVPLIPFQDQKEVEVIDKSHDSFNTILEYLYKNSNSSFILSLKENNSSGI